MRKYDNVRYVFIITLFETHLDKHTGTFIGMNAFDNNIRRELNMRF